MIYVTGDTHGLEDGFKVINFARCYAQPEDIIIVCGDFGAIYNGDTRDIDTYSKLKCTIAFVDGNHENFDMLEIYPITEWKGGKVQFIRPNVIHLMRGELYDIEGNKIFTFGGGTSIDKEKRLEEDAYQNFKYAKYGSSKRRKTWWEQEQPNPDELFNAFNTLKACNNEVDYIITHTLDCKRMQKWLYYKKEDTALNTMLDYINKEVKYKKWYCGHFHEDLNAMEDKLRFMFNDIVELGR